MQKLKQKYKLKEVLYVNTYCIYDNISNNYILFYFIIDI